MGEITFNLKKIFFLKPLQRYVDCSFDNHAGDSSLIAKKVRSKSWKN